MGRGLRQGCPIAPMIHAAWTARLCKKLNQAIAPSWAQEHLTIYADDKHSSWEIHSEKGFNHALVQLGKMIEVIQHLGMRVNLGKSVVVIAMKGRHWQRIQQPKVSNLEWSALRHHSDVTFQHLLTCGRKHDLPGCRTSQMRQA